MAVSKYMATGALTALIASLSLAVAPASAQERGRWQERSAAQSNSRNGDSNARAERKKGRVILKRAEVTA